MIRVSKNLKLRAVRKPEPQRELEDFWKTPRVYPAKESARVELYNYWRPGAKGPTSGWYVFRYLGTTRQNRLGDFATDLNAAHTYAVKWNAEHGKA